MDPPIYPRIWIPTTSETTAIVDGEDKVYTAYNIHIEVAPGQMRYAVRRFHEFVEFDKVWSALYTTLKDQFELPSKVMLFKTTKAMESRRSGLESYIVGLSRVRSMETFVCQFLGLTEDELYIRPKKPAGPAGSTPGGRAGHPTLTPAVSIDLVNQRGMEGLSGKIDGLQRELVAQSGAAPLPKGALASYEENGETYIVGASASGGTTGGNLDDLRSAGAKESMKEAPRGNTLEASEKARRDKEEFLKKNAGVIASLMPGRQLNVVYNIGKAGEMYDRSLGKVQLSLWYRPGVMGNTRKPMRDAIITDDTGGGVIVITVHCGMDLPSNDGISNPYVKTYLTPDPDKVSKQKTSAKSRTVNPTWEEALEYRDIYPDELRLKCLTISVWDKKLNGKNMCMGEVVFDSLATLPRTDTERLHRWFDLKPWTNFANTGTSAATGISTYAKRNSVTDNAPPAATYSPSSSPMASPVSPGGPSGGASPALPRGPPPRLPSGPPPRVNSSHGAGSAPTSPLAATSSYASNGSSGSAGAVEGRPHVAAAPTAASASSSSGGGFFSGLFGRSGSAGAASPPATPASPPQSPIPPLAPTTSASASATNKINVASAAPAPRPWAVAAANNNKPPVTVTASSSASSSSSVKPGAGPTPAAAAIAAAGANARPSWARPLPSTPGT